ncbi:beta-propeller domain-containing protein [Halonotius sp. GCM10025705]|uniref:beta-propeller domain-containing protein n=1 Tax=Halonotius sp. GCM10025705 TaxID=3252678 RepID=UPI0036215167
MNRKVGVLIVIAIVATGIGLAAADAFDGESETQSTAEFEGDFETFDSKAAFDAYLARTDETRRIALQLHRPPRVSTTEERTVAETEDVAMDAPQQAAGDDGAGRTKTTLTFDTRQTNVQETGVGEPDIVKVTDGRTYYAQEPTYIRSEPRLREDVESLPPQAPQSTHGGLHTIQNPNTGRLNVTNTSSTTGKLLRTDTRLVVYNESRITGYDITTDRKAKLWALPLNDSNSIVTTRRIGDIAYFVVRERAATCPVQPIDSRAVVECTDIHRPPTTARTNSNTVYTTFAVDMGDGTVKDELTFLGSDADSAVYMSDDSLYVSYETNSFNIDDAITVVLEGDEIEAGSATAEELQQLRGYDLSPQAKRVEFETIISQMENPREVRQNISEDIDAHLAANKRDLFRSHIVKISASDGELSQSAMGSVPGVPLNQFAFDEEDGKLRIATTVMEDDRAQSENDLYVLDENLEMQGSVQGMAAGQRVYAVRYIGDRGYVITYRQVDPLHVIDLSDSNTPEEVGTLKLPGFSEYLHPVGDDQLLGVGESQRGNGKVVLFDVADPSVPQVADSLVLENTYSTTVSESHHAFMNDAAQQNAYVPAGDDMYVINYSGSTLGKDQVIKTGQSAKRTRLYGDQIVVFSETQLTAVDRTSYNVKTNISLIG